MKELEKKDQQQLDQKTKENTDKINSQLDKQKGEVEKAKE